MLIKSKITTLQILQDFAVEKPYIPLNNSTHSTKDTIPVIVDISANKPVLLSNIGLTFKLYHSLTGILLRQFNTDKFVFTKIEMENLEAVLYIKTMDIKQYYYFDVGLEFPNKLQSIKYELDISVKTNQHALTCTNSGEFYVY